MKKSVKRVSIWKPLVLSIALILFNQQKVYADENEEDVDLSGVSTNVLLIVGGILLGICLLATTSDAADDKSSGTSSNTPPNTSNTSSNVSSRECAEARITYNQINTQCIINNSDRTDYYDCNLDNDVLAAKRHADIMCK
ncbi:hypothetical protein R83H12_00580 [Fibrobacteria bacterium R8-3-H12]